MPIGSRGCWGGSVSWGLGLTSIAWERLISSNSSMELSLVSVCGLTGSDLRGAMEAVTPGFSRAAEEKPELSGGEIGRDEGSGGNTLKT